ncbi:energy transducer TonB [Myroides sp. M-43]|uniref:energy transducer TonB n=1 Tax=Myroides oncorhynchi TaxID=2893756 RepID=UPI001E604173|nr:energy transducer TonB [Myroides oncorhynchi]MCC9044080.1 energy transducer TonB [Myroides oncorhynchi]
MAKNDLFKKDWLDIVFENRNKAYGAYKLRQNSSYTTIISLVAGILLFCAVFVVPSVVSNLFASNDPGVVVIDIPIEPTLLDDEVFIPKDEPEVEIPETKVETVLTSVDEVRFTPLEADHAANITETVATVEELANANPGSETIIGDELGEIPTGENTTSKPEDVFKPEVSGGTDVNDTKVYIGVSHKAEPYGSIGKFNSEFVSKFRTPDMDAGTREIKVIMSFIVEKDGSLTDIKVMRDPGYGVSKEAIRVLKTMSKWKPAMNNDKPVRSQFTLPITIRVQ